MKKEFLEIGKIVGTHGVRGMIRIQPWSDNGEFLTKFKKFYLNNGQTKIDINKIAPHGNVVIAAVKGVDTIEDAEIVVVMKDGAIVSMEVLTKIKYVPTGGDHTDKTVTLTNKIELEFNKNLDKAADYEAPKSTSTGLSGLGLNNAKFYIL